MHAYAFACMQDRATVALLFAAFVLTLALSCASIYRVSEDPSPVVFYSDPKHSRERLLCAAATAEAFLQAFNGQPETARLRIIGSNVERSNLHHFLWKFREIFMLERNARARRQRLNSVLFDISLDLSPFIAGDGVLRSDADVSALQSHIRNPNPLEVVRLCKRVEWPQWVDVSTNIRQQFRALGFRGEIDVSFEASEELLIYQNHPWQNFVRNKITHTIALLSVVGAFVWIPYLWFRTRTLRIETRFHISLDLARYWEHLSAGLDAADGFVGRAATI